MKITMKIYPLLVIPLVFLTGCSSNSQPSLLTDSEFKSALSKLEVDDYNAGLTVDGYTEGLKLSTLDYEVSLSFGTGYVGMKAYIYDPQPQWERQGDPEWLFYLGVFYETFADFSSGSVNLLVKSTNGSFSSKFSTNTVPLFEHPLWYNGSGGEYLSASDKVEFCETVQGDKVTFKLTGADFSVQKKMTTEMIEGFRAICTVHLGLEQGRKVAKG